MMGSLRALLEAPIVHQMGWGLVHFVWQGALVALIVAAVLMALRRRSANARYLVCCVGLGALAACPVATIWMVRARTAEDPAHAAALTSSADLSHAPPPAPIAVTAPEEEPADAVPVAAALPDAPAPTLPPAQAEAPEVPVPDALDRTFAFIEAHLGWVVLVWTIGVLALSARLLLSWLAVRRLRRSATAEGCGQWQDIMQRLTATLRVRAPVRLLRSAQAAVPMAIGFLRPVILLPAAALTGLTPQQVEAVLAHELAHIRRHDYLVNLLQAVVETLLFYHPAVHWVSRRIRAEREQCCDDVTLTVCGDSFVYARALAELAAAGSGRARLAIAATGSLTGRIRRIVGLPDQRGSAGVRWATGLGAVLFVLGVLIALSAETVADAPQPGLATGDSLDIRLVGVRPDGSDEVLDAAGKPIGRTLAPTRGDGYWPADNQRRDFIFEVPETDDPILWMPFPVLRETEYNRPLGMGLTPTSADGPHGKRLVLSCTFARQFRRQFARFFERDVPVEKVDLTLRYFLGPRGKAEFVFTGPFAVDRMVQPDGGQDCQLTPLRSPFENGTEFRLVTSLPFDMNTPVLAYDTSGRRHLVYAGGGRSGGSGANLKYTLADLPLGEVATVTIGEQPRERTFHDIAVAYPDRPARDHAEYLDALAERLGRTNMSPKQIADRPFSSPMDVVRSIDLLRESLIAQAVRTLESGRPDFDLSELDAPLQEKVRATARTWMEAEDPGVRFCGLRIAMEGKWPEFVAPALALLDGDNREGASTAAYALSSYAQQLSAADIGTIKDVLLRRCDRAVLRPLMSCLRTSEHPAATEALWELAGTEDERPWLWWPAVELLANKRVVGDLASLPEGLRARAALVLGWQERGGGAGATPHALLPRLLTAELLERDTDVFREVLRRLCERVDRRVATEAMVGFLRTARDESRTRWALVRVVQQINRWYGVDIGQLGSDIYHEPSDMRALGVPAIVSAAVEWYDGLPEGGPPIPGEGKLYAGQPLDHWLDLLATGAAEGRVPALPAGAAAAAVLALDEGRPEIRATAAEALKAIGGPAVAALTKAVKDGRPPLRVAALSVLGEMRSDAVDALPAIIGGLRDDDQQVRNGAFVAFVQVGPAAPDVVLAATQDADAAVRRAAIDVLSGVLRSSRDENLAGRALPILIAALSDDVTRHDACQALDAMGPRAAPAVPALIGVLETQRRDVAARALGRIGPAAKPAAPALLKLLKDPGRWVPCSAAWALAWICPEDEEVVAACAPVLANVLADAIDREATPEAQWAEEALGLFGPAARVALPQLKQALTSRLAAESRYSYELPTLCWALARLDPKDAESARLCMPFLLASLEPERSIGVRMQAIQALDEFGPLAADAVPDLVSEPWNPRGGSLRDGAAEALGRIGPAARSAVPVLREALKDEYEHVRFRAAIALARIADDDPEVIGEIVPLLRQAAQAQPPAERLPIMDRFEWPFGTPKEPLEYATIRAQAAEALARLAPD